MHSGKVCMRKNRSFNYEIVMPSCFLICCGSKRVLCGTLIAQVAPSTVMDGVLLRAAQTVVGLVLIVRMLVWEIARGR